MLARSVLLAILASLALVNAYEGDGTAYSAAYDKDATGFNACGFGKLSDRFEKYYGAMNRAQFSGSCGKCVRVRGIDSGATGKELIVKMVDECPECKHGDIDFSSAALEAITGFSWDRKRISWEWASCDESSTESSGERNDDSNSDNNDSENNDKSAKSAKSDESDTSDESDNKDSSDSPDEASGEPEKTGTYTKWVVDCDEGRKRCWNLVLASQGYQCMNKRRDKCCLKHNGKICVQVDSVDDSEDIEWEDDKPSKPSESRRLLRMR